MISRGEISPGLWFTLWPKPEDSDRATWRDDSDVSAMMVRDRYRSTTLFKVEAVDLPLVFASTASGERCMLNIDGYDLREVKPELLESVLKHAQRGGAEPSQFDRLAKEMHTGFTSIGQTLSIQTSAIADLQKAKAAPPVKPAPSWRVLLVFLGWVLLALAASRVLDAIWPAPAPAQPTPSTHELHLRA